MGNNILNKIRIKYCSFKYINKHKNKLVIENTKCGVKTIANIDERLALVPKKKYMKNLNSSVERFLNMMISNCKNFNPNIFKENFSHTVFNYELSNQDEIKGNFQYKLNHKNCLSSIYSNSSSILTHEYLHMATTLENSSEYRSGFHIITNSNSDVELDIGVGLNEGYTEVINQRYFNTSNDSIYYFQVKIAKVIEKIIGKDIMEKAYFDLSLDTVIEELYKYGNTKDEIDEFLYNLDVITSINFMDNIYSEELIPQFQSKITSIYNFLGKTFINKLNSLNENDRIMLFSNNDWYTDRQFKFKSNNINDDYILHNFELLSLDLYKKIVMLIDDEKENSNKKL